MSRGRDYVHMYVPPEMHHSGYDEGYYYNYCSTCNDRTEHDEGCCCVCNNCNEDENSEDDY